MTREEILEYFKDINYAYNDCTRYDTLKRMIDELQEPCTDAISREDALMALTGEYTESPIEILPKAIKRINALPPVTPVEKVGQWIADRCDMYICSKCNHTYTDLSGERYGMNFCPNCGQPKMQEVEE